MRLHKNGQFSNKVSMKAKKEKKKQKEDAHNAHMFDTKEIRGAVSALMQ